MSVNYHKFFIFFFSEFGIFTDEAQKTSPCTSTIHSSIIQRYMAFFEIDLTLDRKNCNLVEVM